MAGSLQSQRGHSGMHWPAETFDVSCPIFSWGCGKVYVFNIYNIVFTLKARYDLNCVKSAVKL